MMAVQARRLRSSERRSIATVILTWFLIVVLAISPIPLGSTPPLAWATWCVLLGGATTLYGIVQFRSGRSLATNGRGTAIAWTLSALLLIYLIVQASPLGGIFGAFPVQLPDGSSIDLQTISVAPGDTWLMLLRMVSYGMLFVLVRQVGRDDRLRTLLLRAIVVIVALHALFGLLSLYQLGDTLLGSPKWKYFGVATGTFLNRNSYATYLALGMAVATAMAARELIRRRDGNLAISFETSTIFYLCAVAIIITTIVLTNSRAGLAVAALGAVIILLAAVSNNIRAARTLIYAVLIMLVLFAIMFLSFGEQIWLRFEDSAVSFNFRLELYRQVIDLIARRPLLGFGGGTFEQAFPLVHTTQLPNQLTWDKAHNTYLELWADLGLIFGSIPILLTMMLTWRIFTTLARGAGSWAGQAAAIAAIAIGATHSLVDFSLEIEAVAFLFVAICALGLAGSQAKKAER